MEDRSAASPGFLKSPKDKDRRGLRETSASRFTEVSFESQGVEIK